MTRTEEILLTIAVSLMIALTVTWKDICAGARPGSWLSDICPTGKR